MTKQSIIYMSNSTIDNNQVVSSPLGGNEGGLGSLELTDQHVNSLYCRFCLDTGRQAKISDFYIIIESDFYPDYHPLKEYLEGLPAWDGMTDHIDRLASTVHVTGCTQELHNRFFKKWMVAMVAAWLVDSTTNHEILTYIGPQGIYKSTFVVGLKESDIQTLAVAVGLNLIYKVGICFSSIMSRFPDAKHVEVGAIYHKDLHKISSSRFVVI